AVEEQFRFASEGLTKIVVEVRKQIRIRRNDTQVSDAKPLPGEVVYQSLGAGIGEHAPNFALKNRRPAEISGARELQQSIVGNRAPQEKRQPGCQLEIADTANGAG